MVKTPRTRHSKQRRDPVTIDLGPEEVSRIEEPKPVAEDAAMETGRATGEASLESASAEAAATTENTEGPASRDALDEDLESKIGGEPRYASAFGRSPDEAGDSESDREEFETPSRGSGGRGLVAGLVGGVIALVGAGALQFAGLLPSLQKGDTSGLQLEIGVLRQEIEGLKNASAPAGVDELRRTLGDSAVRIDGLTAAVDQLKSDLAGLRSAVEAGGGGDGAAVQALDRKLEQIEATVAALGENGGVATEEALETINGRITSVESALGAATTAAAAVDERLAAIEKNVDSLSQKLEAQANQPRIALAIAASALKAAVERGGPFAAEVETFAAVAPEAPELPELRAIAERGVPSRADLVAAAPGAANAMIDASKSVDANAGFFDRLVSSAESLVKVRPIGAVEGEGVPEKVARMEAALKDGNLAKALAEYDTLPEPSKAAGAGFAETIRGRLKAEELVDKALADALKAA